MDILELISMRNLSRRVTVEKGKGKQRERIDCLKKRMMNKKRMKNKKEQRMKKDQKKGRRNKIGRRIK